MPIWSRDAMLELISVESTVESTVESMVESVGSTLKRMAVESIYIIRPLDPLWGSRGSPTHTLIS
jgi:hypothetical protein